MTDLNRHGSLCCIDSEHWNWAKAIEPLLRVLLGPETGTCLGPRPKNELGGTKALLGATLGKTILGDHNGALRALLVRENIASEDL